MDRYTGVSACAAIVTVAIAASVAAPAEAAASTICQPSVITGPSSKRPVRNMAKLVAIGKWRTQVGPDWSKWALAKNRSTQCQPAGNMWRCNAKARPCRKLGRSK